MHQHEGRTGASDEELRALVIGYLDAHPTAMDTLDGIAEWWLRRRQIEIEVRRVSSVLGTLVAEGQLEEFQQGGIRFFRRPSRYRHSPVSGLIPDEAP